MWLGKLFKRKKTYPVNGDYKLRIINDDTEILHEILGIVEKRNIELLDICTEAYYRHPKLSDVYQEIISKCNHMNEIIMCVEMFHKFREMKKEHPAIHNLFTNLFGNE